jgi:hypothetical protein
MRQNTLFSTTALSSIPNIPSQSTWQKYRIFHQLVLTRRLPGKFTSFSAGP